MKNSRCIFQDYNALSRTLKLRICSQVQVRRYSKNEFLLRKGEVCEGIFFVSSGCCRSYIESFGRQITTAFALENEIIFNHQSYFMQMPSNETIHAIEDSTCYFLSLDSINILLEESIEFNAFARKIHESALLREMDTLNAIRSQTALERYEYFMKMNSKILQRVPLGHLATFLGMSQETLSRMRSMI